MDNFGRKTNPSFVSEKESPMKKTQNPGDTMSSAGNSRKGFMKFFSAKKKGPENSDVNSPTKPEEATQVMKSGKTKAKMVNRKNIADGRIKISVVDNDRVPEDYQIEYKDNPFEILDYNPTRTTSYIENLRNREFSQINNREVKRLVELQQQNKEIAPPVVVQNLELDLIDLQHSYDALFGKFFRFFQGLLPGFLVIHLFLIFGGTDTSTILNSYVLNCLRINQILYLIAIISTFGAFYRYHETRMRYLEAMHSNPMLKENLGRQKTKYGIASFFFLIVYLLVVYNNQFAATLSNSYGSIDVNSFQSTFTVFSILNAISTACAMIGWISLILAFEEIGNGQLDAGNYHDELTGDETRDDEEA